MGNCKIMSTPLEINKKWSESKQEKSLRKTTLPKINRRSYVYCGL